MTERETELSLESTQTLRPLTRVEMENETALRWFVVELAVSDHVFDPATVPNLDIFLLYRLYSVASVDQGRAVHALRLGFFGEEVAARAVANYLTSYYERPSVKRVSVAERERFSDKGLDAQKDVGGAGRHAVIEISGEPTAPKVALARPVAAAAPLRKASAQAVKKERPAGVFASLLKRRK